MTNLIRNSWSYCLELMFLQLNSHFSQGSKCTSSTGIFNAGVPQAYLMHEYHRHLYCTSTTASLMHEYHRHLYCTSTTGIFIARVPQASLLIRKPDSICVEKVCRVNNYLATLSYSVSALTNFMLMYANTDVYWLLLG